VKGVEINKNKTKQKQTDKRDTETKVWHTQG